MSHKHSVYDTDPHFKIDGDTRTITNMSEVKIALMQGDHNSERFTFELPRYVDGHDMTKCDICQIHYLNVNSSTRETNTGIYEVDDLQVYPDDEEIVILSWLISQNVTRYVGGISFVIRFACSTDSVIDYVWNTAVYTGGISVSSTIYNSEEVVEDYVDILEEWRQKLFSTYETVINLTLEAGKWVEHNGKEYYTQDVIIPNITEKTKIDLQPSPDLLIKLINCGIIMFVVNDNTDAKVYSVGDEPCEDIVIQATVKEVSL